MRGGLTCPDLIATTKRDLWFGVWCCSLGREVQKRRHSGRGIRTEGSKRVNGFSGHFRVGLLQNRDERGNSHFRLLADPAKDIDAIEDIPGLRTGQQSRHLSNRSTSELNHRPPTPPPNLPVPVLPP